MEKSSVRREPCAICNKPAWNPVWVEVKDGAEVLGVVACEEHKKKAELLLSKILQVRRPEFKREP